MADDSNGSILADALDLVHGDLTRFVVFPSAEAVDAVTLWIAATHCQDMWEHASRLVVKSPVKRCGKTRLAEIVRELVHRPEVAGSISAAALVRVIDESDPPTFVLDEADAVFKKRSSGDEAGEALRQILNLGHSRGWPYKRWDMKKREVELCPTFAMALIAGIGDLPDTIEDRAVVVTMQRRAPDEHVDQYRQRDSIGLHQTQTTLAHALKISRLRWLDSYDPPSMPVEDRAADVWEPLIVIADEAGGTWPARARTACVTLTGGEDEAETSLGLRLLEDLRAIWGGDEDHLPTVTVLDRLDQLDESPWPDYYGRKLNPRDLGKLLRPYQVKTKAVRLADGRQLKGYYRADLYPVWRKYTHDPENASQASQASQDESGANKSKPLTRDATDATDATALQRRAGSDGWSDDLAVAIRNVEEAFGSVEIIAEELPDPM